MMAARWCMAAVLAACLVGACSREKSLSCGDSQERYARAASAPPIRIPDDLSPPDEADSLRLPPEAGTPGRTPERPCLESPPAFTTPPAAGAAPSGDRNIGN